jgi:serine/threonine-protein kinase HipA
MLLARASYFALDKEQAQVILAKVYAAVAKWRQIALSMEVGLQPHELDNFASAFEHNNVTEVDALLRR